MSVKWEDRITEIREGSWSYVAGSIGRAPEKVVGTATPREPAEGWDAAWSFSTGDELTLRWHSTAPGFSPTFCIMNRTSSESTVKLLRGRRMQYKVQNVDKLPIHGDPRRNESQDDEEEGEDERERDFVTVVRYSEELPAGRATALINWKLMVVEFIPEEDAVLVLLLCVSLLRSSSEMRKQDLGKLLLRKRMKEPKLGSRDWGSVTVGPPDSRSSSPASPLLQPWHWNADVVMASDRSGGQTGQPTVNHSPVLGSDALYKKVIMK